MAPLTPCQNWCPHKGAKSGSGPEMPNAGPHNNLTIITLKRQPQMKQTTNFENHSFLVNEAGYFM